LIVVVVIVALAGAGCDWTQFRLDNAHSGSSTTERFLTAANAGALGVKWSMATGDSVTSSPAVANNTVYVGSKDGKVYAFNATTGALVWSMSTGGAVMSSPAVANGVVYVGSNDNNVYAFNASTGAVKWTSATNGTVRSSPTVVDGVVYVGSDDGSVYALDAGTGTVNWSTATEANVVSSPAVVNGTVYIGSTDDKLYAINASSGAVNWSTATGGPVRSSPAVVNGTVYVGSDDDSVYALNASTGAVNWSTATGGAVTSSPAVANGTVYVGSTDGNVDALNASSGIVNWSTATGGAVSSSPAVANGTVYIGSDDTKLYALDATAGTILSSTSTGAAIESSPAIANGTVYAGSDDTKMYAFGLALPPIRHVFVIMLENKEYSATFGSSDPYLGTTLPGQGALLQNYYGVGHFSNDNYTAFISGQPPNSSNQTDCQTFTDFSAGQNASGIQQGAGCVYPSAVNTLAGQLTGSGFTWKGYMEDMGNVSSRESTTCAHPALGTKDGTQLAVAGDGYATRHNPFAYFHSIIDQTNSCNQRVVPLGTTSGTLPAGTPAGVTGLATDLQSENTTPNFSFITPNLCNDGHDFPCTNQTGGASAIADIDSFLQTWVPLIEGSAAFKDNGLLIVTSDEAEDPGLDATACCGEIAGPAASHGQNGITGPGGGNVGAVLVSPFITPGTIVTTPFNHYSALASIEDLFGLAHLGQAKTVSSTFDVGVYKK
jgi:outer membrane protein assembly factor BamB